MKKTFLLAYLCILLTDCNIREEKSVPSKHHKRLTPTHETTDTLHITNKYINKILAYNEPLNDKNEYHRRFALVTNEYNTTAKDTIISLYNTKNQFNYYKSGDKIATSPPALMRFKLQSSNIYLPDSIRIGISRKRLISILNIEPFKGRLLLSEEEGYQKLFFSFKGDTVSTIQFESTYLD